MRALLLAVVLALASAVPALAARPGTLDRTFGGDGRVETRVPGGRPAVAGVKVLVGGRPIVVGTVGARRVVVLRYHRSGRLDRRYGERGVVSLDLGAGVSVGAVAFLREGRVHDGRMLIGGGIERDGIANRVAFVASLTSRGVLDDSFGDGGVVRTDAGGPAGALVTDLAVSPGGGIVATMAVANNDLGVARYDSRGRLDQTFGDGGVVRFGAPSLERLVPAAVALQRGRVLVAADHERPRGTAAFVLRLLPDGRPDPAFGDSQSRIYLPGDEANVRDLAVDPVSGHALLTGSGYSPGLSFYLAELPPQPARDFTPPFSWVRARNRDLFGHALALDGRRRRILAGSVWGPEGGRSAFGVARLRRDGRIDRCFGRRGLARVGFRRGPSTLGGVALDGRGRIVAAGPVGDFVDRAPPAFQLIRLHGGRCR